MVLDLVPFLKETGLVSGDWRGKQSVLSSDPIHAQVRQAASPASSAISCQLSSQTPASSAISCQLSSQNSVSGGISGNKA